MFRVALVLALLPACGGASGGAPGRGPEVEPDWVTSLAGDGQASVRGLAGLPGGGAVAVGSFDGQFVAGSLGLTSAGASDGFALRLAPTGAIRWGIALSGPGDQDLTCVAAAGDGSVAVAGTSSGAARLGPSSIAAPGQPGGIVARLDADGRPVWRRPIAATGYAVPTALAWTADGDLVAAGYFAGTLGPCQPRRSASRTDCEQGSAGDPEPAALHAAGSLDLWVARLAGGDGRTVWIHRAGGPGPDAAHALATMKDGTVLVAGSFQRWADFSATTLRSADDTADPFLARVGPDGFVAAQSFPVEGPGIARAVAVAPDSRLAVAITFTGFIELGTSRLASGRTSGSGLVALVEPSDGVRWARLVHGSSSAEALASSGDLILVAGASSVRGGYLGALSATGVPKWSRAIAEQASATALAVSDDGFLIGGSVHDRLIIGPFSSAVAGDSDGFVARFAP